MNRDAGWGNCLKTQPYTKNYKQVCKAGRGGSPFHRRAHQSVVQCLMISPENLHTSNIIWTQHIIFRNTCIQCTYHAYIHIEYIPHICNIHIVCIHNIHIAQYIPKYNIYECNNNTYMHAIAITEKRGHECEWEWRRVYGMSGGRKGKEEALKLNQFQK